MELTDTERAVPVALDDGEWRSANDRLGPFRPWAGLELARKGLAESRL